MAAHSRLSFCSFIAVATFPACGDTLETINITGNRLGHAQLEEDVIRLEHDVAFDAFAALRALPAVTAFSNGGMGGSSYIAVRGGEPNFTLVLLDGIRVNDPSNTAGGAFDLAQIDPKILNTVHVSKVGGTAIHGPDALAGVIHLETRSPRSEGVPRLQFSGTLQTQDAWSGSLAATTSWTDGGVSGTYAERDTGRLSGPSQLHREIGHIKIEHELGVHRLQFIGLSSQTNRKAFPEDSGGAVFGDSENLERRKTRFRVAGIMHNHRLNGNLDWSTRISANKQTAVSETPALPGGVLPGVPARRDDTTFTRSEATTFFRYEPKVDFALVLGAGHIEEKGRGNGELDLGFTLPTSFVERRSVSSVFLETLWSPALWMDVSSAIRWDSPDGYKSRATGQASLSFNLPRDWIGNIGYASSYKLPSIFATSYPLIANPELTPETGESIEIGVRSNLAGDGYVSIRGYTNWFSDLIDFDPVAFTNVNRARVDSSGIEIALEYNVSDCLSISGRLGRLNIESSGDIPLRSRPKTTAHARIEWQLHDRIVTFATWTKSTSAYSSSIPTGLVRLAGYDRVDIGASVQLSRDWNASLRVSNLGDEEYSFAVGVPEPSVNAAVSVSRSFW